MSIGAQTISRRLLGDQVLPGGQDAQRRLVVRGYRGQVDHGVDVAACEHLAEAVADHRDVPVPRHLLRPGPRPAGDGGHRHPASQQPQAGQVAGLDRGDHPGAQDPDAQRGL